LKHLTNVAANPRPSVRVGVQRIVPDVHEVDRHGEIEVIEEDPKSPWVVLDEDSDPR
jgi:hypothetical protein